MPDSLRRDREIRVFISSTFRDMQEERDELIKRVFPQLRRLCADRGVAFTEVDLRWGVTEEEAAEGKVLPICLAEIERCQPYFIGLLGERYGWVPPEIPAELIALQPWLAEHCQKSVTELEILHGVLKNPDMANRAMFYFRDPAYLDRIPAEHRNEFREQDLERIARLAALKNRIRQTGLACRENYPDPATLGQCVLEDLTIAINQEFPPGRVPDALDRDAAEHDAFARSRRGVYIGRPEYFDTLDQHAAGDGPPLVVLGESGSGKSALLANWAVRYRLSHSDTLVFMHFIGATPYSADWSAMLRRLLGELKRRLQIAEAIPNKPEALRAVLDNWLHLAAARTRVVLVLDGLNQLEDRDDAPDLVWLPPVIPGNVRMVLSTLPGRAWTNLQKRAWPTFCMKPLEPDERRRLIAEYLAQFARKLSAGRVERIAGAKQAANPLYLRALLDELRVFGIHEQLDQRIDQYLAAETLPDLYGRILERWEADYERDRPGLVREAMTAIWAARRGLSESELLDVLGTAGQALPRAVWSPLHLAAEQSLIVRSGLIGFFHDYVREAVRRRYLSSDQAGREAHLRLANYLQTSDFASRRIDELAWQFNEAQCWEGLRDCLCNLEILKDLLAAGRTFEVLGYWRNMAGRHDVATEYARAVREYEKNDMPAHALADHFDAVAELLWTAAEHREAERLFRRAAEIEKAFAGPRDPSVAVRLLKLARLLLATNRLRESEELYREALAIQEAVAGKSSLQITDVLNQLANCLHRSNLTGEAEALLCRALAIDTQAHGPDHLDVARDLCNLAPIIEAQRQYPAAEQMYRQALKIEESTRGPNHPDVAVILNNLAVLLRKRGRTTEAETMLRRALEIDEKAFGPKHPDTGRDLGNLAVLLGQEDRSAEAEAMLRRTLDIDEHTYGDNHPDVAVDLHNLASHLFRTGRYPEAEALWRRAVDIMVATRGENHPMTLQIKTALREMETQQMGTEQERKAAAIDSQVRLVRALQMKGDLGGAMAASRRLERMYAAASDWSGVQNTLGFRSEILCDMNDFVSALATDRERERLCRDHGHVEGLVISLANQAHLLASQLDRAHDAIPLVEESYRLATEHGLDELAQQARAVLYFVRSRINEGSW